MPDPTDAVDPPEFPALEAWYKAHKPPYLNTPRTFVWYPEEPPTAALQTISPGRCAPDLLPDGPVHVHLRLAGGIDIGGRLDEIEAYIDAARDALRAARWQAEQLAADTAAEEAPHG